MSTTIQIKPNDSPFIRVDGVANIRASWEINAAGMFSCTIPKTVIQATPGLAWNQSYVGGLLVYEHATAGRWAGRITVYGVRAGNVEIQAQSLHILARKRLAFVSGQRKPAGQYLIDAINNANQLVAGQYQILVNPGAKEGKPGYINQDNEKLKIKAPYGIDLYDELIPMITDDRAMEWTVQEDRYISYARRLGSPTTTVLSEGTEISAAEWFEDLAPLTNYLVGIGTREKSKARADPSVARSTTTVQNKVVNATIQKADKGKGGGKKPDRCIAEGQKCLSDAVCCSGLKCTSGRCRPRTVKPPDNGGGGGGGGGGNGGSGGGGGGGNGGGSGGGGGTPVSTPAELEEYRVDRSKAGSVNRWGALMERRDYPDIADEQELKETLDSELEALSYLRVSLTLDVVDAGGCWARFREGDTVSVQLGWSGWNGMARVMSRALDTTTGVMTVAALSTDAR